MDKFDMSLIPRDLQLKIFYFKNKIEQEEEVIRKTKELKRRLNIHINTINDVFNDVYQHDDEFILPEDPTGFDDYYYNDSDSDSDDDKDYMPFKYNPLDSVSLSKFIKWYDDEFLECSSRPYNKKHDSYLKHLIGDDIIKPYYKMYNEPL